MNRYGLRASGVILALSCALVAAVALFAIGGPTKVIAYGNGDGTSNTTTVIGTPVPFSLNYSAQLKGDYVAAGVGLRASTGGGTITLPAVPGGSTIHKAFLYWSVVNSTSIPALASGSINGNAITGTNYGTTASPCWDSPSPRSLYAFVADVTSFATFGANTLTGFASGGPPLFTGPEPLAEGATLILVYANTASAAHQVDIHQGARSFVGPPIETLTMSGFTAVAGTSQTTWVVADGQPSAPPFNNKTYVDATLTASTVLNGADGDFWDTLTQDISTFIPSGDTSVTVGTESSFDFGSGDCITWVAQALSTPVSSTTFTVNKAYSPSGSLASVPVSVTCTSGAVSPASGSSAPGTPFVATVIGFTAGATCSASETVPAGYIMTSNCGSVAITNAVAASCTITNTETSTTFTVNKAYSPGGPVASVPVTVTCSSGTPSPSSGSSSPGTPFTTTVTKFNVVGSTCSASETVPPGYIATSNCTNVPITNGVPASCTITNTLQATPNPSAVGGLVEIVRSGTGSGGSGTPAGLVLITLLGAAFIMAGGTFAYVRTRR